MAGALRQCREWTLMVVGYADEDEGQASWRLAEERARAVVAALRRMGVDETRLAAVGGGSTAGVAPELRARVEIHAEGS